MVDLTMALEGLVIGVPIVTLIVALIANRASRAAKEIQALDLAVSQAEQRPNDPLVHAYRGLIYERLFRAHQKNGTTRARISSWIWGVYLTLFLVYGYWIQPVAEDLTSALIVSGTVVALAWLFLRNFSKVQYGSHVLEEPNAERLCNAIRAQRQRFLDQTEDWHEVDTTTKRIQQFLGRRSRRRKGP